MLLKDARAGSAPEGEAKRVPFRGGEFRSHNILWIAPIVFAVIIGLWELGSRYGYISRIALPAPSEAYGALEDMVRTGTLWLHLRASLFRLFIGWISGSLLGIAVGVMIGLFTLARAGLLPIVAALFPIPKIALLPLFVIWFGIGEGSKVATILFGAFFPTVIATYGAVENVDRSLVRMGQSFNLSWFSQVRKIILPGALPGILSGLRISASISIILLVAAEMIGAQYGIGAYILTAGSLMATDRLIAGVVFLSIFGLTLSWLIGLAEKRLLDWRQ